MRLKILLLLVLIFIASSLWAQELPTLFKAKSFTEAYYNPVYQELKQRKENDLFLSDKEEKWLELYENYINNYFKLLNNNQQNLFHKERSAREIHKDSAISSKVSVTHKKQEKVATEKTEVEKERDTELLLGHIAYSGVSGIVYGIQLNSIFDIESTTTSVGLTMLLSGGSTLIPIFSPRYQSINSNSLWLRGHGKTMGGLYGYFLAGTLFGEDIFEGSYDYNPQTGNYESGPSKKPVALSLSMIGSISLGHVGFHLGKTQNWTDGRVATYQYYSYAMPALASGLYVSLSDTLKFRSLSSLITLSVPLGYLAAHKLSDKIEYTRGDMTAIINNSVLGAALFGSIPVYTETGNRLAILWPIAGSVLGSTLGHLTYRNFHITRPEGRRLNYATAGGALIGLGTTFLMDADQGGTYLLMSTLFGAAGYGLLLNHYLKQPRYSLVDNNKYDFNLTLHPESFLLNKSLPLQQQAPLFSMRLRF